MAGEMIVEDDTAPGPGQMTRSAYLAEARRAVTEAADSELTEVGRSTQDCPYLEYWLAHFEQRSAVWIERVLVRYAQPAGETAQDLLDATVERVRQGIRDWKQYGRIADTTALDAAAATANQGEPPGALSSVWSPTSESAQLKREPTAGQPGQTNNVIARIGLGSPLAPSVRAPMESFLGEPLGDVRLHTSQGAGEVSRELGAQALTVGSHIAFGPGYRPGTPEGDALLAHELTHVLQQREAATTSSVVAQTAPGKAEHDPAEEEADELAADALLTLWGNQAEPAPIQRPKRPILRRGLRLQSCRKKSSPTVPTVRTRFTDVRAAYVAATTPTEKAAVLKSGIDSAKAWRTQLQSLTATGAGPIPAIRKRIQNETGLSVDPNPLVGVSDSRVEQAYRSLAEGATVEPWILLALWVKEGKSELKAYVNQGTTPENARALWRSAYYYYNMGLDHFAHTIPGAGDNALPQNDADAPLHEADFTSRIAALVAAGRLARDISADINAELTTAPDPTDPTRFIVTPSSRFYSLSLLLADAYYRENKAAVEANPLIGPSADPGLVYARWNMGAGRFASLVTSAEAHRMEPKYTSSVGTHPSIAQWAFERHVVSSEYGEPRANAVRYRYYVEVYRLVFEGFGP